MAIKEYIYQLMTDQRSSWLDKALQRVLWILSLGYGAVAEITHATYQEHWRRVYKAPKPVISVGNITTGGVGKTPLVIWLVKALSQKGIKAAVISRGYGDSKGLNDETRMFQEILPQTLIATGRNRKKSIQKVLRQSAGDVFIADDAFSHWPLVRDLDIVAIDAHNPFGNGYLVPRGILREKKEALVRADVFVLTKTERVKSTRQLCLELREINSRAVILESRHMVKNFKDIFKNQEVALDTLKGQKVVAFCAIGDPSSFEFTIQSAGLALVKSFNFIDHHVYVEGNIKSIVDFTRSENITMLVTTHKDAVKINAFRNLFQGIMVVSLDIDLEITQGQDEIIQRIISMCSH